MEIWLQYSIELIFPNHTVYDLAMYTYGMVEYCSFKRKGFLFLKLSGVDVKFGARRINLNDPYLSKAQRRTNIHSYHRK